MQIGSTIRLIRRANKLTLEDLAHASGTTASYLSRVEMNRNAPSPELLDKVAEALGVTVATIYTEAEQSLGRKLAKLDLPTLTKAQRQLLENYEALSGNGKELVDVLIKTLKKQNLNDQQ